VNINKRLNKIKDKIIDPKFIEGYGLGNEVGYYIFDYDPQDELIVREHIRTLKRIFKRERYNRKVIEFDLYDMLITFAKEKNIFEKIFEVEEKEGRDHLYIALTAFAKPDIFIERIVKDTRKVEANVVFITGVGKVYPFVRSHTILNSLQEKMDDIPVIMFYPGKYDGLSLNLFNQFMDENYYRAFQLVDHK